MSTIQTELQEKMALHGKVRREIEIEVFGVYKPSRGYYICLTDLGVYLHHDGRIRKKVNPEGVKQAFWPTKEEADEFFTRWKESLRSE